MKLKSLHSSSERSRSRSVINGGSLGVTTFLRVGRASVKMQLNCFNFFLITECFNFFLITEFLRIDKNYMGAEYKEVKS